VFGEEDDGFCSLNFNQAITTVCGKVIAAKKEKNKGKNATDSTSKKKYTPASPTSDSIQ
jgi:hypothetical protein